METKLNEKQIVHLAQAFILLTRGGHFPKYFTPELVMPVVKEAIRLSGPAMLTFAPLGDWVRNNADTIKAWQEKDRG